MNEQLRKACNAKERRFAEEFAIDGNASRAAKASGIVPSTGHRWLCLEHVALYVGALYEDAGERAGIDAARVRHEMGCIGFANILDYADVDRDGTLEMDLSALTRDQAAAISEVTTKTLHGGIIEQKVKLYDKPAALRDLAKILGLFVERSEVGKPGEFTGDMKPDEAMQTINDLKGKTGVV